MQHTIKREALDLNLGGVNPYPSRSGVKTEDTPTQSKAATIAVVVPTLSLVLRREQKLIKSKLEKSKPA